MKRLWAWWLFHVKRAYHLENGWRGLFRWDTPPDTFKMTLLRAWSFLVFGMTLNLAIFLLMIVLVLIAVLLT